MRAFIDPAPVLIAALALLVGTVACDAGPLPEGGRGDSETVEAPTVARTPTTEPTNFATPLPTIPLVATNTPSPATTSTSGNAYTEEHAPVCQKPTPAPPATPLPTPAPKPPPIEACPPWDARDPGRTAGPSPTPKPTPYVYEPQGRTIESPDGKILIDVVDSVDDATLDRYLANVTYVYERLEDLYGASPDEQYILYVEDGRAHMKPLQLVGVLFELDDGDINTVASDDYEIGTMTNETSHWFTYHLIRTDQLCFNEALSDFAHSYVGTGGQESFDYSGSRWVNIYDQVITGELRLEGADWTSPHKGILLFAAAAKHGLDAKATTNIIQYLMPIAEKNGVVTQNDIKNALKQEIGDSVTEDIFDTLQPIIDRWN